MQNMQKKCKTKTHQPLATSMCLQREQRISKKITVFFFVLCLGKKIAKDYIGDGLLLLAGTLLATKDLLLREDVVPPHFDHQRAFLLCAHKWWHFFKWRHFSHWDSSHPLLEQRCCLMWDDNVRIWQIIIFQALLIFMVSPAFLSLSILSFEHMDLWTSKTIWGSLRACWQIYEAGRTVRAIGSIQLGFNSWLPECSLNPTTRRNFLL